MKRHRRSSALIYRLYERRLAREIGAGTLPRHIGIILDGNRRHGREAGLTDPRRIYEAGAEKLDDVLDWCSDLAIPAVTLWVCSTENLARPAEEVAGILGAVATKLEALAIDPRTHARAIRVAAIGRLDLLPAETLGAIARAEAATAENGQMVLTIAIGYGGREEIVDAIRANLRALALTGTSLAEAAETISAESLRRHLYMPDLPDPDLIIRTSGELRLSGFLLWQSAYSEFYFADVYWPAFRRIDFLRAIRSFQQRFRRFGR